MDKIILKGMQFYGYHGVLPEEKKLGQQFIVNLELELSLEKAGRSDDVEDTVSYAEVHESVKAVVEGEPRQLIESVAQCIATEILKSYPVQQVTVKVIKPTAPVPASFEYMAVEITRSNEAKANE